MSIHTNPGLLPISIGASGMRRGRTAPVERSSTGGRTVTIIAAVVIEAIVAVAFVVTSVGIGSEGHATSGQPGSAPFVTPAPIAPPTPRPGF